MDATFVHRFSADHEAPRWPREALIWYTSCQILILRMLRAWFLYDFNVREPLDKVDVLEIPHQVYLATRQTEYW